MEITKQDILALLHQFNSRENLSNFENGPTVMLAALKGEKVFLTLTKKANSLVVTIDRPRKYSFHLSMKEILSYTPGKDEFEGVSFE